MERLDTLLKIMWCRRHCSKQDLFVSIKKTTTMSLQFRPRTLLNKVHFSLLFLQFSPRRRGNCAGPNVQYMSCCEQVRMNFIIPCLLVFFNFLSRLFECYQTQHDYASIRSITCRTAPKITWTSERSSAKNAAKEVLKSTYWLKKVNSN